MEIRIAGTADDSIVDGPGFRYTVFTQGCPHHCPFCHNPQTHDFSGGRVAGTDALLAQMAKNPLLDGLTLSGGEPFCQAEACAHLARGARALGLNVWVYSGYTFEELTAPDAPRPWRTLLTCCDVLVDGRFEIALRTLEMRFRGSKNQRLIDLPASLESGCACMVRE